MNEVATKKVPYVEDSLKEELNQRIGRITRQMCQAECRIEQLRKELNFLLTINKKLY